MQNTQQIPEASKFEPTNYACKESSYKEIFNALQSLRKHEVFCDIILKTDDNQIIFAHKVILASASPYFYAMFTKFAERNHDIVVMKQFDSTALKLLVNFIYSGEIIVTEKNFQVLLTAANHLQLQKVKEACCDFLQSQICPTNCIGINAIADLHSCTKLVTSSELYIRKHFLEVVGGDEFLSLSSDQVVKLISNDELIVPSEEKVFESVIRWVRHELDSRKYILPQLMEHVRLSLISKNYILKKVAEEPLIKSCLESKDYIIEALHFHLLKSDELIPQNIRNTPRLGDKVILVVGGDTYEDGNTVWYDPKMNRWHILHETIPCRNGCGVAVVNDYLVFAMGGFDDDLSTFRSVDLLDLSLESPCWKPSVDMLTDRSSFGVGVINNCVYAIGGSNGKLQHLETAEVFDCNTQKWKMIPSMSTYRVDFGIGVLNNRLYVVGGDTLSGQPSNTVECYNPILETWTPVEKLHVPRRNAGVGVLKGILYAVGGSCGYLSLSSVEAYRPGIGWFNIAVMHFPRRNPGNLS